MEQCFCITNIEAVVMSESPYPFIEVSIPTRSLNL